MQEDSSKNRLLLTAALCFLVMMGWNVLFPKKRPNPVTPGAVATATAAVDAGVAGSPEVATATVAAPPVVPTVAVKGETFPFAGRVEYADMKVPYELSITNIGGGIQTYVLPGYKERNKDNEATDDPISLADPTSFDVRDGAAVTAQMAGIQFLDETTFTVPKRIPFEVVGKTEDSLHLRYTSPEGVVIEREYQMRPDSFEMEMAVTVRNGSSQTQRHRMQIQAALKATEAMARGSGFLANFQPPPDHLQGLCYADGEVERKDYTALKKESSSFKDGVQWVAMDRQYFLSAIISRDRATPECQLSANGDVARALLVMGTETLKPQEEKRYKYTAYLGVKKESVLTLVDANLEGAVDYKILGMNLAPLCTGLLWILSLFHGFTGSWGVAILGLTLLVKLVLFPLNQRSGKSMRAMAALRPQLEELKSKYPDDKQRQNEEMMRLYKDHNVSLGGGCLPMLIQMPIWFALYRSLWVSVDLYQQGFLWVADLTTRDPYWILPVTLVVVMFIQQKMTPTTMDPVQQKMMQYTMPAMFGIMMAALPAGLCFYILTNTLLTIVQQHLINKSIGPMGGSPAAQEAKA